MASSIAALKPVPPQLLLEDARAHHGIILNSGNRVRITGRTKDPKESAESIQGHNFDIPVHAGHAYAIVAHGPNRARGVSAMSPAGAAGRRGIVIIIHKIPAMHIVDKAVVVIIYAVTRYFPWIRPKIGRPGLDD